MLNVLASSRASSLPQGAWVYKKFAGNRKYCGSGLARESGGPVSIDVGCNDAFASKLAPTGCGCAQNLRATENTVGAGLLAKAVGQSASMLAVMTPSRASSLPQGVWVCTKSASNRKYCGSEPARESGGPVSIDIGCNDAFASKLAPTGCAGVHKICEQPKILWERACPRKRWVSRHRHWL